MKPFLKALAPLALSVAAATAWQAREQPVAQDPLDSVAAGEAVYIAEGCIHCHSQYSRRDTLDTVNWGPATTLPLPSDQAVLIGNRRQGPDLANVGMRRSREWNRLHLISPSALSPQSRMPAYGHLFAEEADGRGEALLDYLQSLITEPQAAWLQHVFSWKPKGEAVAANGQASFQQHCAQCHGSDGRGYGPVAAELSRPPRDLVAGPYLFAPDSLAPEARRQRLAQLVKFGQPGTSMPGHESLTDAEILALVTYVESLRPLPAEPLVEK